MAYVTSPDKLNRFEHSIILWLIHSIVTLCLIGCAGPMSDKSAQRVYDDWAAHVGSGSVPMGIEGWQDPATFPLIYRMKVVKDYEYENYVRVLRRATTFGEFGSDSIKIILDSLVAVTGSAGTKAALGAASAGVTGATTSLKKNVLFDQSITTFITKMDTLRLNKWNEILCKMGRCADSNSPKRQDVYTIAEAFSDLEEYGRLGTLDAALRDIDAKASAEQKKAQENNAKINKIPDLQKGLGQ